MKDPANLSIPSTYWCFNSALKKLIASKNQISEACENSQVMNHLGNPNEWPYKLVTGVIAYNLYLQLVTGPIL